MATSIVPRIIVADVKSAVEFYTDVFGFTFDHWTEFSNPTLIEATLTGADDKAVLILMQGETEPVQQRPGFPLVMEVDDVDAVLANVRDRGLDVLIEPLAWGELTLANVVDPDGYIIELVGGGLVPVMPGADPVRAEHPAPQLHDYWSAAV